MSREILDFCLKIIMDISTRIKEACKAHGTSMYKLEKELGLGNGTIGKWGKNGRTPNYANLLAVANALGVTVDDLTGTAETQAEHPELWAAAEAKIRVDDALAGRKKDAPGPQAESANEKLLIDLFRQLSPERQQEELAYLAQAAKRGAVQDM